MWNKFLDKLDVLLEPQIDASQFVTHYVPALPYKKNLAPIIYTFENQEETYLNQDRFINSYTQELQLKLEHTEGSDYNFKINTLNSQFNLDKSLTQQGKLLESLAQLTEIVTLKVTKKGTIKSVDYQPIIKKWDKLKVELLKTYQNNQVKGYIEGIDKRMNNETLFLEELKQVKLYGLLFNNYQAAHEKDKTMPCKIGNLIHCLPVTFEETIQTVNQDKALKEKHIVITGTMKKLGDDVERRIENYLTYFDIKNTPITLSSYKRDVILDTDTGYPKSVALDIALTNGNGYIRKQRFNLKIKSNG